MKGFDKAAKYLIVFSLGIGIGITWPDELKDVLDKVFDNKPFKAIESRDIGHQEQNNAFSYVPKINVCFTPPQNCSRSIVENIERATSSIYV